MDITLISGEGYEIRYEPVTATIEFHGSLRLLGASRYNAIIELLENILAQHPKKIIINLRKLAFLNSSGINALSKFIIKVRDQRSSELLVLGAAKFTWQSKSLRNLQRLMPGLQLEITPL